MVREGKPFPLVYAKVKHQRKLRSAESEG